MHSNFNDVYRSIFPNGKYLTSGEGNTNVILSAPHGGGMKPLHIPRRKYGTKVKDSYTRRLIERIISNNSFRPFYVFSDIHRSRVDLNRGVEEGAQGDYYATRIWKDWNGILDMYTDKVSDMYNRGLYVDIHSHNDGDFFELGYNLGARDYRNLLRDGWTDSPTTLDSLEKDTYEMIFDTHSFKNTLESHGYSVFMPKGSEVYFNGGRNVETYNGNGIGAIQIECPISALQDNLGAVATAITKSIDVFMKEFV